MKLFDAHCHLQPAAVFDRAAAAGVERMAVCGTSSNDWNQIFQLSEKFPQIVPMIGVHPWFVKGRDGSPLSADSSALALAAAEASAKAESRPGKAARPAVEPYLQDFQTLEKLLRENPHAGIGETGLDLSNRFENRAEQEASFAAHLDLARELNRPVAVHCVQAWGRLIEIMREHPAPRILLHAFGGAPELIPELVELNGWFSFCASVTNPNAKRVRAAVVAVPENHLLIETDSPDFPPPGCEAPNEPANLIHVARAVAELRGVSADEIARITFTNATELFGII